MKLAIMGAGAVGTSVAELASTYDHTVTGIGDSSSAAVDPDGLDVGAVLERKRTNNTVGRSAPEDLLDGEYDVLIEATPTTLGDAEPGYSHVTSALERDRHVVLANKGPVAERYDDVRRVEQKSEGTMLFDATVGGAIPVVSTIEAFDSDSVTAVRGVLNGTANFILSRMATDSLDYEHVLAEAQDLGVAEADPTFDVDGTDAALKCVIIANVLYGGGYTIEDALVEGIQNVPASALSLAAEDGRTIRLIGDVADERILVGPRLVPESGTLAVSGTQNIVQIETQHAGRLNVSGRGAGGHETATAVLRDVGLLE
ncbi:homoserine dehydrogenase [Halocatena halophila]|uniref:homoserine dehydrogenase n=1 Tax=Halocatena halophila TaxID=2814576 RepID=UPI002ED63B96